jgi:hypothetical protein
MKRGLVAAGLAFLLGACSSPKGPSATLLVTQPVGADDACLGVVGFDITSTGAGKTSQSGPILNAAAVQSLNACQIDHPFVVDGLATDAPISVTVHGYDGAGQARVMGTGNIANLGAKPDPIVLSKDGTPQTPLIIDQQRWLGGIPLSQVESMTLRTVKGGQPTPILSVTRAQAGAYFDVDPGGFGVELSGGEEVTLEFTFSNAATTVPKQRLTITVDPSVGVYRAQ